MTSLKFLFFVALAIACVFAAEPERVKKAVVVGNYPYAYSAGAYSGAYVPTAYTGYNGYAGYAGYPYNTGYYNHYY